jgi:2,3-bisphosphoglycerate-independent phosphoglycerate mutase
MRMFVHRGPLVLAILDGWGYRAEREANAIAQARKPVYDKLLLEYPNTLLHASDHFVGLPDGQMGNSEVGHLNIGAGRVVEMDITRIDALIAADTLAREPAEALIRSAAHGARCRCGARICTRVYRWTRHDANQRRRLS